VDTKIGSINSLGGKDEHLQRIHLLKKFNFGWFSGISILFTDLEKKGKTQSSFGIGITKNDRCIYILPY